MNPFKVKNDSEGIHEWKVSRLKGSSVKGSFKKDWMDSILKGLFSEGILFRRVSIQRGC